MVAVYLIFDDGVYRTYRTYRAHGALISPMSLHVALRRPERMKSAARGWGKLVVCLDSFDAAFREGQANFQFALTIPRRPIGSIRSIGDDHENPIGYRWLRLQQCRRGRGR